MLTFKKFHLKPIFMIIGVQKTGTTALASYLTQHPQIEITIKEIDFFSHENQYKKGIEYYHRQFPLKKPLKKLVTFDATPDYLYFPEVAKRLYNYNPALKLVVLVRHPIKRAFSQWNMYQNWLEKNGSPVRAFKTYDADKLKKLFYSINRGKVIPFEDLIKEEMILLDKKEKNVGAGLLERGLYHQQLMNVLKYFHRDQLFIIETDDLLSNTETVLAGLNKFIGVKEFFGYNITKKNTGIYNNKPGKHIINRMLDFYAIPNQNLFDFLGCDYGWNKGLVFK